MDRGQGMLHPLQHERSARVCRFFLGDRTVAIERVDGPNRLELIESRQGFTADTTTRLF